MFPRTRVSAVSWRRAIGTAVFAASLVAAPTAFAQSASGDVPWSITEPDLAAPATSGCFQPDALQHIADEHKAGHFAAAADAYLTGFRAQRDCLRTNPAANGDELLYRMAHEFALAGNYGESFRLGGSLVQGYLALGSKLGWRGTFELAQSAARAGNPVDATTYFIKAAEAYAAKPDVYKAIDPQADERVARAIEFVVPVLTRLNQTDKLDALGLLFVTKLTSVADHKSRAVRLVLQTGEALHLHAVELSSDPTKVAEANAEWKRLATFFGKSAKSAIRALGRVDLSMYASALTALSVTAQGTPKKAAKPLRDVATLWRGGEAAVRQAAGTADADTAVAIAKRALGIAEVAKADAAMAAALGMKIPKITGNAQRWVSQMRGLTAAVAAFTTAVHDAQTAVQAVGEPSATQVLIERITGRLIGLRGAIAAAIAQGAATRPADQSAVLENFLSTLDSGLAGVAGPLLTPCLENEAHTESEMAAQDMCLSRLGTLDPDGPHHVHELLGSMESNAPVMIPGNPDRSAATSMQEAQ